VYAAIKRTYVEQLGAQKRALIAAVPMLAVLSPVRPAGARAPAANPRTQAMLPPSCAERCRAKTAGARLLSGARLTRGLCWRSGHAVRACGRRCGGGVKTRARARAQENQQVVAEALEPVDYQEGEVIFRQVLNPTGFWRPRPPRARARCARAHRQVCKCGSCGDMFGRRQAAGSSPTAAASSRFARRRRQALVMPHRAVRFLSARHAAAAPQGETRP
jgi:hypothetical protein